LMGGAIGCPECNCLVTRVIDTSPDEGRGSIRRRRECVACGARWSTLEIEADRLELLEEQLRPNRRGGAARQARPPLGAG